ncbi:MAG TPA: hypothetical protein VJL29_06295 [Thermoguttaceae bacterium]|nr:hypothetical protein [Thermoguttaceae bacterium]
MLPFKKTVADTPPPRSGVTAHHVTDAAIVHQDWIWVPLALPVWNGTDIQLKKTLA